MNKGLLILVSAPSGAGKTSLVNAALEKDENLIVSISHTTRSQRPGEEDGVQYHFVDKTTFADMRSTGDFLEHAEVFDNYYGTAKSHVEGLQATGRDVVLEIDWQGADQVRTLVPDVLSIFILPPSEAVLRDRLNSRGQDSAETIERRLREARLEMAQAPKYNYILVNDDFDATVDEFLSIVKSARLATARQIATDPRIEPLIS